MLLRVEDTDRERSTAENVEQIQDALRWLELDWDGDPVSQCENRAAHSEAINRLIADDHAYRDAAAADEVKAWKAEHGNRGYRGTPTDAANAAVRLRVPDSGETVIHDLLRGEVGFPNEPQDDFVIARADGTPLYNLAVAVDDAAMGVTDVVRGDDHLSNTPKQVLVLRALGVEPPRYAHLPLLHGPDGKKLSKRHGAASVQELRAKGFLPAAVRNYMALLGWGSDDDTTIMDTPELIRRFDLARVGRAAAIFDERKLRWINGRFMRDLEPDAYLAAVVAYLEQSEAAVPADRSLLSEACLIAQDKAQTLAEVWPLIGFVFGERADDEKARRKFGGAAAKPLLRRATEALAAVEPFVPDGIEGALAAVLAEAGVKPNALYQPIRVALTGTTISPGIFESLAVIGRAEALARLEAAIAAAADNTGATS